MTSLAWLLGFAAWAAPALAWAARGEDAATRALLVLLGLAAARIPVPSPTPRRDPLALLLAVGGPIGGALALRVAPLDTLHALAAIATGHGLLALHVSAADGRRLRALAVLLALALPLATFLDVIVGWPLRKATAGVAAALLGGVPVETVIRIDGALAFVDLPCAGVRSLWIGGALLAIATLALRRPVDLAWCGIAAVAAVVLVAGNTARVVAVVGLHHALGLPLAAEIVHAPLGILVFAAAGLVAGGLLLGRPEVAEARSAPAGPAAPALGLAALLVAFAIGRAAPAAPAPVAPPPLPPEAAAIAPSPAEVAFAAEHGARVVKGRLEDGAVVLVASRSWLAHHVPEQCLEATGWRLDEDHPRLVGGAPVRVARARRDGRTATAIWWFQSGASVTDDLVVRIRDGLARGSTWVLVSVLVEGEPAPERVAELVGSLRASVGRAVEGS